MRYLVILAAMIALLIMSAHAEQELRRSATAKEFMRLHPCPAGPNQGHRAYPCKGWVIDHIVPLCNNGSDSTDNMQWQTVQAARDKDAIERCQCGLQHKHCPTGGMR